MTQKHLDYQALLHFLELNIDSESFIKVHNNHFESFVTIKLKGKSPVKFTYKQWVLLTQYFDSIQLAFDLITPGWNLDKVNH